MSGPMPDALKTGAKTGLGQAQYNRFVVVSKDLKAGKIAVADAQKEMQMLMNGRPDLIKLFADWSAPAQPSSLLATPPAPPGSVAPAGGFAVGLGGGGLAGFGGKSAPLNQIDPKPAAFGVTSLGGFSSAPGGGGAINQIDPKPAVFVVPPGGGFGSAPGGAGAIKTIDQKPAAFAVPLGGSFGSAIGGGGALGFGSTSVPAPKPLGVGGFGGAVGARAGFGGASAASTKSLGGGSFGGIIGAGAGPLSQSAVAPAQPHGGGGFTSLTEGAGEGEGGRKTVGGGVLLGASATATKPLGTVAPASIPAGAPAGISSLGNIAILTGRGGMGSGGNINLASNGGRFDEGRHGPLSQEEVAKLTGKLKNLNPPMASLGEGAAKAQQEEWLKWLRDTGV